jgi:hypothetical protein
MLFGGHSVEASSFARLPSEYVRYSIRTSSLDVTVSDISLAKLLIPGFDVIVHTEVLVA